MKKIIITRDNTVVYGVSNVVIELNPEMSPLEALDHLKKKLEDWDETSYSTIKSISII